MSGEVESKLQEYKNKINDRRHAPAHAFEAYGGNFTQLQWNRIWKETLNKEENALFDYEQKWGFYRNWEDQDTTKPPRAPRPKKEGYKVNNIVGYVEAKASDMITREAPRKVDRGFSGSRPLSSRGRIQSANRQKQEVKETKSDQRIRPQSASGYKHLKQQDKTQLADMLESAFRNIYGKPRVVSSFSRINNVPSTNHFEQLKDEAYQTTMDEFETLTLQSNGIEHKVQHSMIKALSMDQETENRAEFSDPQAKVEILSTLPNNIQPAQSDLLFVPTADLLRHKEWRGNVQNASYRTTNQKYGSDCVQSKLVQLQRAWF